MTVLVIPIFIRPISNMAALRSMKGEHRKLQELCEEGYPVRGQKPAEEASEGIPILKVRNITGQGIDIETGQTQRKIGSLVYKNDVLITVRGRDKRPIPL